MPQISQLKVAVGILRQFCTQNKFSVWPPWRCSAETVFSSRPMVLQVPDGFICLLWSKKEGSVGPELPSAKRDSRKWTGHQRGNDNSPARTLRDEPGHKAAVEAHQSASHPEAAICHDRCQRCQPCPAQLLLMVLQLPPLNTWQIHKRIHEGYIFLCTV